MTLFFATRKADLDGLAARIDRLGIEAVSPNDLADVAARARQAAVHPEVVALLTDVAAPSVVRARAFGHIHRRLANTPALAGYTITPAA